MTEIAKIIIAEGGWQALALFALLYLNIVQVRSQGKTNTIAVNQSSANLELIVAQTAALRSIHDEAVQTNANSVRLTDTLIAHDERVASMRSTIDAALVHMNVTISQRDNQIKDIPGQVKAIMSDDLEELKRDNAQIVDEIKALRVSIDQRIETLSTTIPDRIIDPLKQEIAALTQKIDLLLDAKAPPAETKPEVKTDGS